MDLARHDARVATARRRRLASALGDLAALIPAGAPLGRNFPANTYAFRASSHFLYLVGVPVPGAFLLVEGDRSRLFVPEAAEADALWHGPLPERGDLAAATGAEVLPLDRLHQALASMPEIATVGAPDLGTRRLQEALLGRSVAEGAPGDEVDGRLRHALVTVRLRHDEAALGELREAGAATVEAHLRGMRQTRPDRTEAHVCAVMEGAIAERGMQVAYGSIVTVHGEILHDTSRDRTLCPGQLLLCDVGAESRGGWAADVTRTWPVGGRFSATQRDLYDAVLGAQRAAVRTLGPGVRFRDVHLAAERALGEALVGLGILKGDVEELVSDGVVALFFPHGVGHLLGLDVHDMEDLGDLAGYPPGRQRDPRFGLRYLRLDRELAPDMVVTIEPGFYQVPYVLADPDAHAPVKGRLRRDRLEAFADVRGIRIEDDVRITERGAEVLTEALPREARAVEEQVGPRS